MREILFRGKCEPQHKWVYGYIQPSFYPRSERMLIMDDDMNLRPVISETVGEYSGILDKNDVPIFEGDVVDFESHGYIPDITRGVVVFKKGCFGIEFSSKYYTNKLFHRIGEIGEWRDMGASGKITYTYEVIGNIHDNPELLKEGICTNQ